MPELPQTVDWGQYCRVQTARPLCSPHLCPDSGCHVFQQGRTGEEEAIIILKAAYGMGVNT